MNEPLAWPSTEARIPPELPSLRLQMLEGELGLTEELVPGSTGGAGGADDNVIRF